MDDLMELPLESTPLGCMETVGQYLRRNREKKGISVEEVALHTRIQAVFIYAIEEDQFDKIASLVSAKGFVRSYARFLKVDEAEALKCFSESVHTEGNFMRLKGVDSQGNSILSTSTTSLASPISPKAEHGPGMHLAEETLVQTSSYPKGVDSSGSSTFPEVASRPLGAKLRDAEVSPYEPILDMGTIGVKIRTTPPYAQLIGVSAVCLFVVFLLKFFTPWGNKKSEILVPAQTQLKTPALRDMPSPVTPVILAPLDVPSNTAPEKEVPIVPSDLNVILKPFILSLEAREPTWVKVLVDGKGTKDVLLRKGEKAVWQADKAFLLTMGNGGGAEVFLDGKELGFLGKQGEVIRDRLLTRVASEQTVIDDD